MSRLLMPGVLQQSRNFQAGGVPTDGLISYYKLNGNGLDEQKNNDGTLIGSVTSSLGVDGSADKALFFPKNENSYIDINPFSDFDFNEGSFCLWIKEIQKNYDDNPGGGGVLEFSNSNGDFLGFREIGGSRLSFRYRVGGINTDIGISLYNENNWVHLACLWNSNQINLFIDGVKYYSKNIPNVILSPLEFAYIMKKAQYDDDTQMAGYVDDILIYDRELTSSEIQEIYNLY